MILIRLNNALLERGFTVGQKTPPSEILEGLPPGCSLENVELKNGSIEILFSEPTETGLVREINIIIKSMNFNWDFFDESHGHA